MPQIESWIEVPARSDFPIYNLPYGAFRRNDARPRIGVAIGTKILDLYALADAGLLDGTCEREVLMAPTLNAFLAKGRATWRNVRFRIAALLRTDEVGDDALRVRDSTQFFIEQRDARMTMPVEIGDYVDFYSSL